MEKDSKCYLKFIKRSRIWEVDTAVPGNRKQFQETINNILTICITKTFFPISAMSEWTLTNSDKSTLFKQNAIHRYQEITKTQKIKSGKCLISDENVRFPHLIPSLLTKISVCFVKWTCWMNPYILLGKNHKNRVSETHFLNAQLL